MQILHNYPQLNDAEESLRASSGSQALQLHFQILLLLHCNSSKLCKTCGCLASSDSLVALVCCLGSGCPARAPAQVEPRGSRRGELLRHLRQLATGLCRGFEEARTEPAPLSRAPGNRRRRRQLTIPWNSSRERLLHILTRPARPPEENSERLLRIAIGTSAVQPVKQVSSHLSFQFVLPGAVQDSTCSSLFRLTGQPSNTSCVKEPCKLLDAAIAKHQPSSAG